MARLFSKILLVCSAIHLWRPGKVSNILTYDWHINHHRSTGLLIFVPSLSEACMSGWTCSRAFSISGTHLKLAAFWVTLQLSQRKTPKLMIHWLSNPIRPKRHCALSLVIGENRWNKLSFFLRGMDSIICPILLGSWEFQWVWVS